MVPLDGIFIAHRDPRVRDDTISPRDGALRIVAELDGSGGSPRPFLHAIPRCQFFRRGDLQPNAEPSGRVHTGCEHVIRIAAPGDGFSGYRAWFFLERPDIRQHLTLL